MQVVPVDGPPHPLDDAWYVDVSGKTYGPYTGHEIGRFVRNGRLTAGTLVSRSGTEHWVQMSQVPDLASMLPDAEMTRAVALAPSPGRGATVSVSTVLLPNIELTFTQSVEAPLRRRKAPRERPSSQSFRNPSLALLLSLIFAGFGQIYNGEVVKGICMISLCFALWLILLGWVISIWSMADAYVVAKAINLRVAGGEANGRVS